VTKYNRGEPDNIALYVISLHCMKYYSETPFIVQLIYVNFKRHEINWTFLSTCFIDAAAAPMQILYKQV
jgi:hypothetical protein